MNIENAARRHRFDRSWLVADASHTEPDVPDTERDPRATRWVCLALGAFWIALVTWMVL